MSAASPSKNEPVLRQLSQQLDAVEAELKRLGWWSEQPPDLRAEVAAGRLKSYLDAPSFELWLQCLFLPNARSCVGEADLPETSSVGEMARRQYDFHSFVPEAQTLLKLLREFDELIERYHQPPVPKPAVSSVPPEMEAMFSQSRGLLLRWLDLTEDQLKRRGWWDGEPNNPGSAPGRWMRDRFLPETRASIHQGVVPAACDLAGEMTRRLAADGLTLPEEMEPVLNNFDEGVATYHSTWQLCGLPPAEPMAGAVATPPEYTGDTGRERPEPAPRVRLAAGPPEALGFELILEEARGLLGCVVDCIETEVEDLPPDLPPPPGNDEPVEEWLTEEFLPDVREWLEKGQVPEDSRIAASATQEFKARGVLPQTAKLREYLRSFDERVAAYHQLSLTLPQESAGARMTAAWRLIMAAPVLEMPVDPELDDLRVQMLILLNRIEAELHLLGWWCALPSAMPTPFQDIEYPRWEKDVEIPRFETWLLASWLPRMRERVHASRFPDSSRVHDHAVRSLCEERLGKEKYEEARRLIRALDELETLMLKAWPAAMLRHGNTNRRRGLTPPKRSSKARGEESEEVKERRGDVEEALRLTAYELKALGWWGCDVSAVRALVSDPVALQASNPPPFEHWLEAVAVPGILARLKESRLVEERSVSDYVAWECRHCGQSKAAGELLKQLEKLDHWVWQLNRARREVLED